MAAHLAHVLVRDPDLAGGLQGDRLQRAERDLVAATAVAFEGPWDPEEAGETVRGGIGLLLLDGLVVRRVGRTGRYGAELLGPGDLMRPWQHDGEDVTLPFDTTFRVIEQADFALLDRRFATRAAPYPEVSSALIGRAMQRSRTLVVNMAIAHYPRIDRRLLMLMWHLADRWGVAPSVGNVGAAAAGPRGVSLEARRRMATARRAAGRAVRGRARRRPLVGVRRRTGRRAGAPVRGIRPACVSGAPSAGPSTRPR
jgi:CRP/FNR family cyclic AMP-dependent transcriptional regulator